MKIIVLMGGTSSERDVSLASGVRVARALRDAGHTVTAVDTTRGALQAAEEQAMLAGSVVHTEPPTLEMLGRMAGGALTRTMRTLPTRGDADVIFLALHGGDGEDGTLQALLDLVGIPYTGSGHLASALAMDKDLSKRLFRAAGIQTPDWLMAPVSEEKVERSLGFPVVVKPSREGSTVGLSVVRERSGLAAAVAEASRYDNEVMIERFIAGRELTVTILGDEALPVGEIFPKHEIYDYECKYTDGMAREEFPARLSPEETAEIQRQALTAFRALKLKGYARIDFRMSEDGIFHCLEANTLPGMTGLSLVPQAAVAAGISFPELCERIVRLALD
ncbi:MAG TPA: D-alanine--D-alanine ligase [Gemmatimonadaceae bacterium]|nr:D-alanine--D-alanine ligase [Gemmatimonadaceae bacterium]